MKSITIAVIAVATLLGVGSAVATNLPVDSNTLQVGKDDVEDCDTSTPKFTFTFTKDGSNLVTAVTVEDIASACNGGTLYVTLADSAGQQLAEGVLGSPIDAAMETVTVSPAPLDTDVDQVHVAITGP